MLIILETSRAELLQQTAMRVVQRAEEFARLYGVGALSQETMLDLMGFSQSRDRSPPLVFESTPSRRPNVIMEHWISSMSGALVNGDGSHIRGVVFDSLTDTAE